MAISAHTPPSPSSHPIAPSNPTPSHTPTSPCIPRTPHCAPPSPSFPKPPRNPRLPSRRPQPTSPRPRTPTHPRRRQLRRRRSKTSITRRLCQKRTVGIIPSPFHSPSFRRHRPSTSNSTSQCDSRVHIVPFLALAGILLSVTLPFERLRARRFWKVHTEGVHV